MQVQAARTVIEGILRWDKFPFAAAACFWAISLLDSLALWGRVERWAWISLGAGMGTLQKFTEGFGNERLRKKRGEHPTATNQSGMVK